MMQKLRCTELLPFFLEQDGLDDPCGSFPTQDSLWFYDLIIY